MYNLYDKYLRGNSICCCPLYVSYYLLYVLTWELNRYRPDQTRPDRTGPDRTRQTHFKSFHCIDKPIGASPRRDYVLTRMVLLYKYNLVLYFMVRNDTLKKGGNAPRATDEKRFLSSASPY